MHQLAQQATLLQKIKQSKREPALAPEKEETEEARGRAARAVGRQIWQRVQLLSTVSVNRGPPKAAMEAGRRPDQEGRFILRTIQAVLGVAVVALAMINGGVLTSYFTASEAAPRHSRYAAP